MLASGARHRRLVPSASTASAVSALLVDELARDLPRIAFPTPEIHLGVRVGPSLRRGVDGHAFGVREQAYRKTIRAGHWSVMARLQLGAHAAVLGVRAPELAGRIVALEELWSAAAVRRLYDGVAAARDPVEAAAVLERAIAERLALSQGRGDCARTQLSLECAALLASANVNRVAARLGVSERHLRRVFHETIGVSPKTFARLARFHRALDAARAGGPVSWASIAAASGYYDQAHLIAEFRGISGATPQALLEELRSQPCVDWHAPQKSIEHRRILAVSVSR